ncbi:MAG: 4-(cytidine 5'-diphospho)-2-C-methyl-D-erythritol kinase [Pirellula sp.]|jgi:4-diphosphocytidyl-2-C-methyl-D-erythritol kinase
MLLEKIEDGFMATVPCKLNLYLKVLGKRADGYHELDTIMVAVSLCDRLVMLPNQSGRWNFQVKFADNRSLTPTDHAWDVPSDSRNLVLRALRSYVETMGVLNAGADLILHKGIPSMAGLGGGSADAAAALALAHLAWSNETSIAGIAGIARGLGSDINFFLESHANGYWAARCRGRGEKIEPVPIALTNASFLLMHPPEGCGTAAVFSKLDLNLTHPSGPEDLLLGLKSGNLQRVGRGLHNDLEAPAEQVTEWILRARKWIDRYDHHGQAMSGSGSARFCLCRSHEQAETINTEIQRESSVRAYAVQLWQQPSLEQQLLSIRGGRVLSPS